MGDMLASNLKTARIDESGWHDSGEGPGTTDGKFIQWLTISDQAQSVTEDVKRIRSSSMVPSGIPICGFAHPGVFNILNRDSLTEYIQGKGGFERAKGYDLLKEGFKRGL